MTELGAWGEWGACSVSCGMGEKQRTMMCMSELGLPGPCEEMKVEKDICMADICPGHWSEWSAFEECSVKCGPGTKQRTRQCLVSQHSYSGETKEALSYYFAKII